MGKRRTGTVSESNGSSSRSGQKPKLRMYCAKWEKVPEFQEWIGPSNLSGFARCRLCFRNIRAHRTDLLKHCTTKLHAQSIAINRSYSVKELPAEDSEYDTNDDTNSQNDFEKPSPGTPKSQPRGSTRQSTYSTKRNMFVSEGGDISVMEQQADNSEVNDTEMIFLDEPLEDIQSTMGKLRLEKLKLEVEKERLFVYKLKLESLKLEKELHLPRSTHTASLKVIEIPH